MKMKIKGLHIGAMKLHAVMPAAGSNLIPVGSWLELDGMKKERFRKFSYDEIKAFYKELAAVKVSWATVRFKDGSGIFFPCGKTFAPEYGLLDEQGCIVGKSIGYVTDKGKYFVLTDADDYPLHHGKTPFGINGIENR